jgi:4-amino-4-deoxyprephenate dehydrogenase
VTNESALAGRRCVVVGGSGAVGGMFVDLLLATGAEVCIVDVRDAREESAALCAFECGDITAIGPWLVTELRRAELVVLAVPEQVALAAVEGVAAALAPGALLVDTTSVKSRIVTAVGAHASHLEAVSLNPMFAPSLGIDGGTVAAVVVHDGPQVQELLRLVGRHGGRVVQLTADAHDRLTGATQALTHAAVLAFGLALCELDLDIADLGETAPPPHLTLLALLARISSGEPETYWDVQAANPHARHARTALAAAVRRLADVVDSDCEADFGAILAHLRGTLDRDAEDYRHLCEQVFRTIRASSGPTARHTVLTSVIDER